MSLDTDSSGEGRFLVFLFSHSVNGFRQEDFDFLDLGTFVSSFGTDLSCSWLICWEESSDSPVKDLRNDLIPSPKSFAKEGSLFPPKSKRAMNKMSRISVHPSDPKTAKCANIFKYLNDC
ncbi:hypothetical protein LEP1GSC170_4554 [Leptospira interrogans serovar Bataviae str. HAI135]|nr:hypothetical protein LEP1GSC170_4554 [Leptospira interrogans serovar Bataviae str. HAI135]